MIKGNRIGGETGNRVPLTGRGRNGHRAPTLRPAPSLDLGARMVWSSQAPKSEIKDRAIPDRRRDSGSDKPTRGRSGLDPSAGKDIPEAAGGVSPGSMAQGVAIAGCRPLPGGYRNHGNTGVRPG